MYVEGKAGTFQSWIGQDVSKNLRSPDFMTMAQDGGCLTALHTGRFYPQEILLVLFLLEAESNPGP